MFSPLARPQYQLRSLPLRMRWEVTRRHPIYLMFWNDVSRSPTRDPRELQARQMMANGAAVMLMYIGVSTQNVSPSTEYADLAEENVPGWMAGSVHPISFRGILGLLLAHLPPTAIREVVEVFELAASLHAEEGVGTVEALLRLRTLSDDIFNQYSDELIVCLSPTASVRQLQADISSAVESFRSRRSISPQRNREDRYEDYLRVWDLREGWVSGEYRADHEHRFEQIATELQESISTVHNRYRSAFELITGHPYSPELWFRVFAPLKVSNVNLGKISEITLRRPSTSRVRREVPESIVCPAVDGPSLSTSRPDVPENDQLIDMLIDMGQFVAEGLSNEDIADRFGIDDSDLTLVEDLCGMLRDRPLAAR